MSPTPPLSSETPATLSLPPKSTPTLGPGGNFTVACSTTVAAAPLICLQVILDSSQYPTWNRFCRKCTIDSQPHQDDPGTPGLPDPEYLRLGTKFTFDVYMDPSGSKGRATELEVSVLEHFDEAVVENHVSSTCSAPESASPGDGDTKRSGWRVAWKTRTSYAVPGWMLRSERVQEFVQVDAPFGPRDELQTAYSCWETFYGVLAPVVRLAVGSQLVSGFNLWMADMKKQAEELEMREGAFAPQC